MMNKVSMLLAGVASVESVTCLGGSTAAKLASFGTFRSIDGSGTVTGTVSDKLKTMTSANQWDPTTLATNAADSDVTTVTCPGGDKCVVTYEAGENGGHIITGCSSAFIALGHQAFTGGKKPHTHALAATGCNLSEKDGIIFATDKPNTAIDTVAKLKLPAALELLESKVLKFCEPTKQPPCTEDGWCTVGNLQAQYECDTADPDKCLQATFRHKSDSKTAIGSYKIPEYRTSANAALVEFSTQQYSAKNVIFESGVSEDAAFFQVALPLIASSSTVAQMVIAQGVFFKDYKGSIGGLGFDFSKELTGFAGQPNSWPKKKMCLIYDAAASDKCKKFDIPKNSYKFNLALHQTTTCVGCIFYLNYEINYSGVGSCIFNGITDVSKMAVGESAVVKKVLVGKLEWVFSSSVNYNNDEQKANGVTVFLKAKDLAAKKVILSFKMAAPGNGKFLLYDPDVKDGSVVPAPPSPASTAGASIATLVASCLAALMLF